ncbi:MAG: hypothetical protein DMG71_19885 [Acidobacteria bacterium]|nr:MAG: hypothetical protein DMG71_19885 [Acidobacteriota bacterium]
MIVKRIKLHQILTGRAAAFYRVSLLVLFLAMFLAPQAWSETCLSSGDMDAATRTALETAGKRYFDMAARGDVASLRQNAIPSLANDFSGVEAAVKDNQTNFAGAQATPRPPFLLKEEGNAPAQRAEFFCGVFGSRGQTADSAVFVIPNLAPGNYGIVTLDVPASKGAHTLSFVLQQMGAEWKLGGFYARAAQVSGHDSNWFIQKAREYKAKGQMHNAFFYYREAEELISPVPFMSTLATDKLYDEAQAAQPADLPTNGPVDLAVGGKTYKITTIFPLAVGNDLNVVVKYQYPDVSNTAQTFQDNIAVIKALVAKYPELRDAFGGVVARAVETSGRDYGVLLPMKDVK